MVCDFAKMSMPANLHLAFQALSLFEKQYGVLPKAWDEVCLNINFHDYFLISENFRMMPKNSMKS